MPAPSLLFGEREPLTPWRPLTYAEERTDVIKLAEQADQHARDFAITMAKGAKETISDLRGQVERMGDTIDPAQIVNLKASPAVTERLRQRLEAGLLGAYDTGAKQGLDAIEASTKEDEDDNLLRNQ